MLELIRFYLRRCCIVSGLYTNVDCLPTPQKESPEYPQASACSYEMRHLWVVES